MSISRPTRIFSIIACLVALSCDNAPQATSDNRTSELADAPVEQGISAGDGLNAAALCTGTTFGTCPTGQTCVSSGGKFLCTTFTPKCKTSPNTLTCGNTLTPLCCNPSTQYCLFTPKAGSNPPTGNYSCKAKTTTTTTIAKPTPTPTMKTTTSTTGGKTVYKLYTSKDCGHCPAQKTYAAALMANPKFTANSTIEYIPVEPFSDARCAELGLNPCSLPTWKPSKPVTPP